MLSISKANRPFHTEMTVPGDKSISHRSVMFGALADGDTRITGFLKSADCISTMNCFRGLGIHIEDRDTELIVHGRGSGGLSAPLTVLDAGNSGTTIRLMSGILSAQSFESGITGDTSIQKRPMNRIIEPLKAMGADIESVNGNGCAPLKIKGGVLHSLDYISPVASAQVKSSILLAALSAGVTASVTEPTLSRDHTERMLNAFGARVDSIINSDGSATARISSGGRLKAIDLIDVPGDISSASYFLAAVLMVPDSEILIKNVGVNPTRDGIIRILRRMGADVIYENYDDSLEPRADLRLCHTELEAHDRDENGDFVICGDIIPSLIDELPLIAVLATRLKGRTIIKDASELRVKESDRIAVMTENLRRMGAEIEATPDGFVIDGGKELHGAMVQSRMDHRIAMSLAIAALSAEGETVIEDAECVNISYPEFYEDLNKLKL